MRGQLTIACLLLAATCRAASADVVVDCQQERRPEFRLRACTEIIKSQSFRPDQKALAYRSRGEARTDAGAFRQAIADFTESIRLKKNDASAFAGRGRAKFIAENLTGSISDYSQAIRLSPVSEELYIQRGHVYTASGRVDAAIRDLTEAIRLNPRSAFAYNERGVAHVKKGDLARAQDDYSAAIEMVPLPQFYSNRGFVYESQGRTRDAIDDFKHALLGDPSIVDARAALKRLGALDATVETDRRVREGEALAEKNCSRCHAVGAKGVSPNKDAPEFRNVYRRHQLYALRASNTRALAAVHDQMPQFNSTFEEIDTIVAYINSLSTGR